MANLSITNVCNRKCVYCFANDTRIEYGQSYMEEDTYKKALDYLERSEMKQVRLLGGEPTLHPNFPFFVQRALDMDFEVMLFTNGLISEKNLAFLASTPENKVSILLNTIHPNERNLQGMKQQQKVMNILGKKIIAGVNIYTVHQQLDYLLDYVVKYNLKHEVRLGLAHSVLSQSNAYLHPKEYYKVGHNIAMFKRAAKNASVSLGFDCGFVPCMFPEEYCDLLSEELKKAGNCCHPIIDMLSDGTFISCYPLNNLHKIKIRDKLHAKDLIRDFENVLLPYKDVGIFRHCTSCSLFKTQCNGGCMSFRIQRYIH